MAWLDPLHHQTRYKAANSEQGLSDSEKVGAIGGAETGLDFCDVVDEEACNSDLGTDVAELCCDAPEERVLVAERLVDVAGCGFGLLSLGRDIGVCDFGDAGEESVKERAGERIEAYGAKKKTTARAKTKQAMPRYTHCTDCKLLLLTFLKRTKDARTGATTLPIAWKA